VTRGSDTPQRGLGSTAEPSTAEGSPLGPPSGDVSTAAASSAHAQAGRRSRWDFLRRYLRGLDHIGLALGFLAFLCSLTPSLLPRSWQAQGLVSGLAVTAAYAVGAALTQVGRWAGVPPLQPPAQRRIRWIIVAVGAVVVVVALWLGSTWQEEVRRAVGMPPQGRYLYLGVLVIAAAVFALLLGFARVFADLYRRIVRRLLRVVPPVVARLVAIAVVALLAFTLLNGALYHGFLSVADKISAAQDARTEGPTGPPSSPLRSGGPGSLVAWSALGREGRKFVSEGPSVAEIEKLTGRPAVPSIRAYAGLRSAPTLQGEADLVLAELRRTGAFGRSLLAVATTTGTGWVDPTLADPLEYMYGGNTAIASMQYSYLPSWINFIADRGSSQEAGRTLFDTIYDYWATLPSGHRPRLVAFGESLGTFGGTAAFSGVADLINRTQGDLFAGAPNSTELWRQLTDARVAGSPERLPVYANATTVRFAGSASDLRTPDGTLPHPRVVFAQHASDPIVWWSPDLILSEPDWLGEARGPDVLPEVHWYPLVTFWQVTWDMAIALSPPAGHGHHYGAEIPTAWAAILHPPGWTDADTTALGATP
jgi:uncharacterized membrane protein